MLGRRPTDSCQLRRWQACGAAGLAAQEERQQTAGIAHVIATFSRCAQTPLSKCGRQPVSGDSRSLTGKTSPG
jgi:hypothetical protein